jgi:hypothetical protein
MSWLCALLHLFQLNMPEWPEGNIKARDAACPPRLFGKGKPDVSGDIPVTTFG